MRATTSRAKRRALAFALLPLLVLTACSSGGDSSDNDPQMPSTTLTVLAAASLTEVFPDIGSAFTEANPDVTVQFSFAGSQELVAQVDGGAPADVLALAGTSALEPVQDEISEPVAFAGNKLTIIVPPGNPAGVQSMDDLADPSVAVVLAAPEVPAGQYARDILDNAGLVVTPVSEEADVKAVVSRVALGGADAGIVYVTDASAAGDSVESLEIPKRLNVIATYPAVTIDTSTQASAAADFVEFLLSNPAQSELRDAGFLAPPPW